ncbi:MAG: HIRAN domain-containing protein [Thiohalocapsa sp.]
MRRQNPGTSNNDTAHTLGRRIMIQRTTLSGFRHYDAPRLWPALQPRVLLTLRREAGNPHDCNAVALHWRGRKLGYLPRQSNLVVARLLDRDRSISARIVALAPEADRNERIQVDVLMH